MNWDEMTVEQKRCAVAEDVIRHVHAGNYRSAEASYVDDIFGAMESVSFGNRPSCKVCQRGGMFLSTMRLMGLNRVEFRTSLVEKYNGEYDTTMKLWSREELANIEAAFEGYYKGLRLDGYRVETDGEAWEKAYTNKNARMVAICQNILRNNGTFVPDDLGNK